MEINSAKFICSNTDWKKCPDIHQPEYTETVGDVLQEAQAFHPIFSDYRELNH